MEWYYAVGDKQMGPVNEEEFKRLAAEGTIRPDTLVWNGSMKNWQPYRDVVSGELSSTAAPATAPVVSTVTGGGTVVCRECGKLFKGDEVRDINGVIICTDCEPAYRERLGSDRANAEQQSEEELLSSDYRVDIGEAFSGSLAAFQRNMGILIGGTVLMVVIMIGINLIPWLSFILALVLTGPLMGGFWYLILENVRGHDPELGDLFGGFGPSFGQLVLTHIVTQIASLVCMLPLIIAVIVVLGPAVLRAFSSGDVESLESMEFNVTSAGVLMLVATAAIGFLASVFLAAIWVYALPLVIDKQIDFWSAMELSRKMVMKRFFSTLLLGILCSLTAAVGMMLCGVGFLFTAPLAAGAIMVQYETIFGRY